FSLRSCHGKDFQRTVLDMRQRCEKVARTDMDFLSKHALHGRAFVRDMLDVHPMYTLDLLEDDVCSRTQTPCAKVDLAWLLFRQFDQFGHVVGWQVLVSIDGKLLDIELCNGHQF